MSTGGLLLLPALKKMLRLVLTVASLGNQKLTDLNYRAVAGFTDCRGRRRQLRGENLKDRRCVWWNGRWSKCRKSWEEWWGVGGGCQDLSTTMLCVSVSHKNTHRAWSSSHSWEPIYPPNASLVSPSDNYSSNIANRTVSGNGNTRLYYEMTEKLQQKEEKSDGTENCLDRAAESRNNGDI